MFKTSLVLLAAVLATTSALELSEFFIIPHIIQGENATRGQFPFYALLQVSFPRGAATCGGSLISDEWIVTAAHCLEGAISVDVHLGSLKASDLTEEGRLVLTVESKRIFVHPHYSEPILWNDIGLIHLPRKVKFTETIKPITLACKSSSGLATTAIGNGLMDTNATEIAPILQFTTLTTFRTFHCLREFPFLWFRRSVICVRGKESRSACSGDSGGPLIIQKTGTLIGATSFGSEEGCHLGLPHGYTNLSSYLRWIKQITGISKCQ